MRTQHEEYNLDNDNCRDEGINATSTNKHEINSITPIASETNSNEQISDENNTLTAIKPKLSDKQVLSKARNATNGEKFSSLFDWGDTSNYETANYADLALCNLLAFWTQRDRTQMEKLFWQSALGESGRWQQEDYRRTTINKAIANCTSTYEPPPPSQTGNTEDKKEKKPVFDESLLRGHLIAENITIRLNTITKDIEVKGVDESYNPESILNDLPAILHDKLKANTSMCSKATVQDMITVIAGINRYNPVVDMLTNNIWDNRDRLEEFFRILGISETDTLSRLLIYKWLWQGLSMVRNELKTAYGADGVLVLMGPQGIGKTSLVSKLAIRPEFCKLGQHLDSRDKDTYRRAVSAWIIEFGEIESTFRSDLERLKAFITNARDEYRLPYGRADQVVVRRSVIIGTCNSEQFLIDQTGSRRFWTIPVTNFDLNGLAAFDALQLWLQIDSETKHDPQGFRLTKDEQEQLAKRNSKYEKPLKGESEVRDVLAKDNLYYQEITVSAFKDSHPELRSYSVDQLGRVLNKLGIEQRKEYKMVDGKRTSVRLRLLPIWKPPPAPRY